MPTKEELQALYATLPIAKLLSIIEDKFSYTDMAVATALEEIAKRNISAEEIKEYKDAQIKAAQLFMQRNIVDALPFWQKNAFYFLWLPILNFAFKTSFREGGYFLKLRQANYYSLCGFLGFILTGVISAWLSLNDYQSVAIWIAAFIPAYLLDENFNRHFLKRKFPHISDEQE